MDKRYVFCLLSIYLNLGNEDIFFFVGIIVMEIIWSFIRIFYIGIVG